MRRPRLLVFAALALLATIFLTAGKWSTEKVITPLDNAQALLSTSVPGDDWVMEDGTYPGGIYISSRPGTADAPITLRARNPGKVVIKGSTSQRRDTFSLYRSGRWNVSGITFENAARSGIYLGESSFVTFTNCTSRLNGVVGLLAGSSSNGTVTNCLFLLNTEQHGAYVSGKVGGWVFENCTSAFNGRAGIQFNSQGSGGVVSNITIRNCSLNNNGRLRQAAAINLLGVVNSVFAGNTIHDNWAGGISFTGNGTASGASTGNLVVGNCISFRPGEGRTCVQSTGGGTNTVTGNRLWAGKASVQPITAVLPSIIVQAGNTVLPTATPVSAPPVDIPAEPVEPAPAEGTGGL